MHRRYRTRDLLPAVTGAPRRGPARRDDPSDQPPGPGATGQPTGGDPAAGGGDGGGSPSPVEAELARARREAAKYREQARTAQTAARTARISEAATRAAARAGVDVDALADSLTWQRQTEGLDPAAPDFAERLQQALDTTVAANPRLRTTAAAPAGRSGGELPNTPASRVGMAELAEDARRRGDWRTVMAIENQKLTGLQP